MHDQAQLFLLNNRTELAAASDRVRHRFEHGEVDAHDHAATLYLLGWTEMRLRLRPVLAVELLTSAAAEAKAVGSHHLEQRAQSHLTYTLAWAGRMHETRDLLAHRGVTDDGGSWWAFVGDGSAIGAAYAAYMQNDLRAAIGELQQALRSGSSSQPFYSAARVMLALVSAATGDPDACRRALAELREIPAANDRGLSWSAFRHMALAALYEASGRRERAMQVVLAYQDADDVPLATVVFAGIAMRARRPRLASQMLHRIDSYSSISYVRAATLLADAHFAMNNGHPDAAHEMLERSLDAASEESLRRLYVGDAPELRQLLTDHLAWGTAHDDFITECLSPASVDGPLMQLSERELDVYAQLRTTRTMKEIADHLNVSINTVKTHQRAIYRKLGVSTRREAVRISA
ncbi:LuxR C-terminal-related transcriptional regulator [Gordonia sp. (in: high G+C Gram-positive bacteria)]|uniref:LuxR C-terminal-related transcriptional regulator n=1 Tax=Gordonia sp. (in: high G+C Gram-positive bacteria) TaxID=84139 RepID=UPI0016BAE1AF|nr:LuxR family transcriptional regulator [Gordonia sp. (in: high G+C Gram-positive bacteria)]NLG46783.1 hypothetical protein [Gordonia sp. (in: high G+C Gram-positive bacteria)]